MTRLVREVPSVRFRLSSIEATEIDDALFELFVERAASISCRTSMRRCSPAPTAFSAGWAATGIRRATYARAIERLAIAHAGARTWRGCDRRISG